MSRTVLDRLAEAVLYEGFLLYPYRRSLKNGQRWTFGGLYPRAFCDAEAGVESPRLQVECLVEGNPKTRVSASLRFLRLIDRRPLALKEPVPSWPPGDTPDAHSVESLAAGQREWHRWQEATDHKLELDELTIAELAISKHRQSFALPPHVAQEPVADGNGRYLGVIERHRHRLEVAIEVGAIQLADRCFRLTLSATNETRLAIGEPETPDKRSPDRMQAALAACIAAYVVIELRDGQLVSQIDPPECLRPWADENNNIGVWPVLVGEPPNRSTLFAPPIILDDYPRIAAESPAMLFDSTEVDEMLILRIMTLTDAEKQAMRSLDARGRDLLDRVEALSPLGLARLHGTIRTGCRTETPFAPGDRVRLAPRKGADLFDLFLHGKTATITSVEEDLEGRCHFAVVLDDDPGRDLGEQLQVGHRFFFKADEIMPLDEPAPIDG